MVGVLRQESEHAVQRGGHGVEPAMRKRKQMSRMSSRESRCPSTSALRNRETRSSWAHFALVEHPVEVLVMESAVAVGARRRRRCLTLTRTWPGRMMPSFMARKRSSSLSGRPSRVKRPATGTGWRTLPEVDLAPVDEAVDEIVDEDGHLVLHRRHEARGENRSSSLRNFLCSAGRSGVDERAGVLEIHRGHIGREELRMAQGLVDIDLAAQDNARPGMPGRTAVPQRLEHGLGVGRHVRVHPEGLVPSSWGVSSDASMGPFRVIVSRQCGTPRPRTSPPGEENAVYRLHECTVVGLGNDEARCEEADDDVDQLFAAEASRGDGRGGVDRIAELGQEFPLEFRQWRADSQYERRLGLETARAGCVLCNRTRTPRMSGSAQKGPPPGQRDGHPSEKVRSSKIATASKRCPYWESSGTEWHARPPRPR